MLGFGAFAVPLLVVGAFAVAAASPREKGLALQLDQGTRKSRRAAAGRAQLLAKSSSTTGGIQKVEQTAPLRDGPATWAWDF